MDGGDHICRICLKVGDISLFDTNQYGSLLMSIASVEVHKDDQLPSYICTSCLEHLKYSCDFKKRVEDSDLILHSKLINDTIENDESGDESQLQIIEIDDSKNNDDQVIYLIFENEGNQYKLIQKIDGEHFPNDQIELLEEHKLAKDAEKEEENIELKNILLLPNKGKPSLIYKLNEKLEDTEDENDLNTPKDKRRGRNAIKKYMCDTCGKTFLFKSNLNDHVRIHSGDKPFVCSICGHRFSQSGHLNVHARIHTGIKPYNCEVCQKSFTVRQALKKHMRIHTGERPYSCSFCKKKFVTSYHLTNHYKRHTGEKNFKCEWPGCIFSFINISEMKRHVLKHNTNKNYIPRKNNSVTDITKNIKTEITSNPSS